MGEQLILQMPEAMRDFFDKGYFNWMMLFHAVMREELHDMTAWYIGVHNDFHVSAGKMRKYFKKYDVLPSGRSKEKQRRLDFTQGVYKWKN